MKVLFVHDSYDVQGGAEYFVQDQIEVSRRSGIDVYTFYVGRKVPAREKIYVYRESDRTLLKWLGRLTINPFLILKLQRVIKEVKPDIIHLHHIHQYPLSFLLCLPKNIPIVKSVYDYSLVCASAWGVNEKTGKDCYCAYSLQSLKNGCVSYKKFFLSALKTWAMYYLSKSVPKIIFVADEHMKQSLQKVGFNNNIQVVSYFNPKLTNNPSLDESKVIKTRPHILFIGNLTAHKGIHDLITAVGILYKNNLKLHLDIIGNGPEMEPLKKASKKLRLEKIVTFYGVVPRNKLPFFYNQSLVLVIPSVWKQNLPLVMMEAMAKGLPVVSSDTGSAPFIIKEGENGFLYKARNINDLAKKLEYCLKQKDIIINMRKSTQAFAYDIFNPQKYAEIMKQHYKGVLLSDQRRNN